MPKTRLPPIADRAVREKVSKAQARIRWKSVLEKVWNDIGRNQEDVLSVEKFGPYKTKVQERTEKKGKAGGEKQGERGGTLEDIREVKTRYIGMKACLHGPMDYAKAIKLRYRVGDLDLPESRTRYTSSREEEEGAQKCPRGKSMEWSSHLSLIHI